MRRDGRWWRWGVVALVLGVLVAAPAVVAAWPVRAGTPSAAALLDGVRASTATPYEAYVATRGRLALPDVGPLDDVASCSAPPPTSGPGWQPAIAGGSTG